MEFLIQLVLEQGMFCNSGWYGPCCMSGRLLLWIGVCILLCLINTITYSSKKKKNHNQVLVPKFQPAIYP